MLRRSLLALLGAMLCLVMGCGQAADLRAWLWDGRFSWPQDAVGRTLKPSPCNALVVADTIAHDDATTRQLILTLRRLGYEDADIFIYLGTTWSQPGGDDASYLPTLSPQDELASEGRFLRQALDEIRTQHGEVCFDIVSHSLGSIAARLYLQGEHYLPGSVRSFLSSGTAHQGSDLAAANDMVRALSGQEGMAGVSRLIQEVAAALNRPDLERFDPAGPIAEAMHPHSPLLQDLAQRPFPTEVRTTTVQGARNIVVLHGRGHLRGGQALFVGTQHDEPWDEDFPYILYNGLAGRESLYLKSQALSAVAALYHGLFIRPLEFACAVLMGLEPYTERRYGVGFSKLVLWLVVQIGGL